MADYTPDEIVDMILILGECQQSYRAAARLYRERFPNRRHPSAVVIRNCEIRARQGFLHRRRHQRRSERSEILTLAAVAANPHTSTRFIENNIGVSRSTASRILRQHRFHPYHISLHQALSDADYGARLRFCQWSMRRIMRDPFFFSYVLFSDEATFKNTGEVNRHNFHYWCDENPHWHRAIEHQHQWSLNVWCGIVGGSLVGPYFFNGTLTGERYNNFLRNEFQILLEDIPLATRVRMWFQHDGAPAHYDRRVRQTLHEMFPSQWIGRGSPTPFPPRSPDLTPLDFYLWGYIKDKVYVEEPTTPENMKTRIINACSQVTRQTLEQVELSFRNRIQCCIDAQGHPFEFRR